MVKNPKRFYGCSVGRIGNQVVYFVPGDKLGADERKSFTQTTVGKRQHFIVPQAGYDLDAKQRKDLGITEKPTAADSPQTATRRTTIRTLKQLIDALPSKKKSDPVSTNQLGRSNCRFSFAEVCFEGSKSILVSLTLLYTLEGIAPTTTVSFSSLHLVVDATFKALNPRWSAKNEFVTKTINDLIDRGHIKESGGGYRLISYPLYKRLWVVK